MVIKKVDIDKCTMCLKCYNLCPMDVFSHENKKVIIKYEADCQSCYLCVHECQANALIMDPNRPVDIYDVYSKENFREKKVSSL